MHAPDQPVLGPVPKDRAFTRLVDSAALVSVSQHAMSTSSDYDKCLMEDSSVCWV